MVRRHSKNNYMIQNTIGMTFGRKYNLYITSSNNE